MVEFKLEKQRLSFPAGDDYRNLNDNDILLFETWHRRYQTLLEQTSPDPELGREIHRWLNATGWLDRVLKNAEKPPLLITFTVPARPEPDELLYLEVPWELLASDRGYLAEDAYLKYSPIRRIGPPRQPAAPSDYRLSLVFMAAAPREASPLSFEAEETAILKAAKGAELTVEESGTLELLAETVTRENPIDALHLSCHGHNLPEPHMAFETDEGDLDEVRPDRLDRELGPEKPRLVFLSACKTSEPCKGGDTLSSRLIRRGFSSVLGWGG